MAFANLKFIPTVTKARKPKFELRLKIYDLNNVPLVSGTSCIKWHLSHSIHAEHRGRTPKCPISNHRVEYNYTKVVSAIRIGIDKNNNLAECPIEFEVLQEFSMAAGGGSGGRDEKITLGVVRLNLSEYVEESDVLVREATTSSGGDHRGHFRRRSAGLSLGTSPKSTAKEPPREGVGEDDEDEEGIVRRHLIQESKINSTLKIGILMVQVDGDRNYIAPPLKTAPVFGGIAGIMTGEQPVEQEDGGQLPSISKSRDAAEVQDMYRRALLATWTSQFEDELPADEVVEDIFNGGTGWKTGPATKSNLSHSNPQKDSEEDSGSISGDEGLGGTLRPSDLRRLHLASSSSSSTHHRRHHSGASDRSITTVTEKDGSGPRGPSHRRVFSKDDGGATRSRSESLTSLAPTMGSSSDRGRGHGWKPAREVDEFEVREDLIAWRLREG